MKKIIDRIGFLAVIYSVGVMLGLALLILKVTGRIKILHPERFPREEEGFLLVSNHPSLLDPFAVFFLFFPDVLFHPLKYSPFHTPDRKNFYNPWYFRWIRPFSIPVDRYEGGVASLRRMKKVLDNGKRIILFPEGGRTCKGTNFRFSQKGKKIRRLAEGAGWLAANTGVPIVHVWLEGTDKVFPNTRTGLFFLRFWKRIVIKIGVPLIFLRNTKATEATEKIEEILLRLADE